MQHPRTARKTTNTNIRKILGENENPGSFVAKLYYVKKCLEPTIDEIISKAIHVAKKHHQQDTHSSSEENEEPQKAPFTYEETHSSEEEKPQVRQKSTQARKTPYPFQIEQLSKRLTNSQEPKYGNTPSPQHDNQGNKETVNPVIKGFDRSPKYDKQEGKEPDYPVSKGFDGSPKYEKQEGKDPDYPVSKGFDGSPKYEKQEGKEPDYPVSKGFDVSPKYEKQEDKGPDYSVSKGLDRSQKYEKQKGKEPDYPVSKGFDGSPKYEKQEGKEPDYPVSKGFDGSPKYEKQEGKEPDYPVSKGFERSLKYEKQEGKEPDYPVSKGIDGSQKYEKQKDKEPVYPVSKGFDGSRKCEKQEGKEPHDTISKGFDRTPKYEKQLSKEQDYPINKGFDGSPKFEKQEGKEPVYPASKSLEDKSKTSTDHAEVELIRRIDDLTDQLVGPLGDAAKSNPMLLKELANLLQKLGYKIDALLEKTPDFEAVSEPKYADTSAPQLPHAENLTASQEKREDRELHGTVTAGAQQPATQQTRAPLTPCASVTPCTVPPTGQNVPQAPSRGHSKHQQASQIPRGYTQKNREQTQTRGRGLSPGRRYPPAHVLGPSPSRDPRAAGRASSRGAGRSSSRGRSAQHWSESSPDFRGPRVAERSPHHTQRCCVQSPCFKPTCKHTFCRGGQPET